jgi:hypothetical protein
MAEFGLLLIAKGLSPGSKRQRGESIVHARPRVRQVALYEIRQPELRVAEGAEPGEHLPQRLRVIVAAARCRQKCLDLADTGRNRDPHRRPHLRQITGPGIHRQSLDDPHATLGAGRLR